jgi:Uncharacterized conserved protein
MKSTKKNMELSGIAAIKAPPARVWAALNDPVILAGCVSGCDSFERIGPHEYGAIATVNAGVVRSRISVNIAFTESDPPRRAVFTMRAKGTLGSGEAAVTLHLDASDGGTNLRYQGQAHLGGHLGRLVQHWGRDMIEELVREFFRRFAAAIPAETMTAPSEPPQIRMAPKPAPLPQPTMRKKALWIGLGAAAGAVVTAAAAVLLTRRGSR